MFSYLQTFGIFFIVFSMEINHFGALNSEVWGNVSDWAMFVVTTVTGILVWRTLRSQTEVLKLQQTNSSIEIRKYLRDIRPDFEAGISRQSALVYNLSLTITQQIPKNITYKITSSLHHIDDITVGKEFIPYTEFQTLNTLTIVLSSQTRLKNDASLGQFSLFYQDQIGTNYTIDFYIEANGKVDKKGPKMISDIPQYIN